MFLSLISFPGSGVTFMPDLFIRFFYFLLQFNFLTKMKSRKDVTSEHCGGERICLCLISGSASNCLYLNNFSHVYIWLIDWVIGQTFFSYLVHVFLVCSKDKMYENACIHHAFEIMSWSDSILWMLKLKILFPIFLSGDMFFWLIC
jgi:hypothetical protein